ncbi:MAG TPA: ABC-three component system middle component 5 [Rhizomicrobium sp.]|jgi:hypothetical protein|nr:ABC-three component system middle component 5 [Rhizomicrobium sp.]
MIQLSYESAFDPFHTVFRFLRLWPVVSRVSPIHRDKLRILDFFLLFPFRIGEINLAQSHRQYRKIARTYEWKKPYGEQPDSRGLFDRMQPIQAAATETLASRLFVEPNPLTVSQIVPTEKIIPILIAERIAEENGKEKDLIAFLAVLGSEYDLTGAKGLKARTHLMEHRYDAV